jgi:hypothetical protein
MKDNPLKCPHCQKELMTWEPSPYTGWGDNMLYCDNNECGYFVRGREKICREYDRNFAYRYCYNPKNGQELPLARYQWNLKRYCSFPWGGGKRDQKLLNKVFASVRYLHI